MLEILRALEEFSVNVMGDNYIKIINDAIKGNYPIKKNRRHLIPINLRLFALRELIPLWMKNIKRRIFN